VPDRDLLVALPMTLNRGLAERGAAARLRARSTACSPSTGGLVRRLCG